MGAKSDGCKQIGAQVLFFVCGVDQAAILDQIFLINDASFIQ